MQAEQLAAFLNPDLLLEPGQLFADVVAEALGIRVRGKRTQLQIDACGFGAYRNAGRFGRSGCATARTAGAAVTMLCTSTAAMPLSAKPSL